MSAPSTTASQTEFCDAMSKVHVYAEPFSDYDTPIPICKISTETIDIFIKVNSKLEPVPLTPENVPLYRELYLKFLYHQLNRYTTGSVPRASMTPLVQIPTTDSDTRKNRGATI